MPVSVLAFLIGVTAGLRTFTPLAAVSWGAHLGWLHLELFSVLRSKDKLKYLAGSESGMAVWINDATPEQIAERLRTAL